MKLRELQTILDGQPSVTGNTFIVGFLYILAIILAAIFLILGVGLFLEGWFDFKIFLNWVSKQFGLLLNDDQRADIARSFGTFSLLLALIFAGFIYLCKMVLSRNNFIIQIEDWIFQNISEVRKSVIKKKKSTKKV